jgi:putative tricarboxylic transport membrane protein
LVIEGLIQALSPQFMLWLTVGVLAGMVVGALPGLTATMGVALLVPFTFDLPPGAGLAMLGALYVCAMFSDAIPAVLVNTPGTPAAMATAFDGYPMTLQGRAQAAIVGSCFSAALGAMFGAAFYLLLAWPLGSIALRFGPPEFFWIGVFSLTIIGSLAGKSMLKGIAGGGIGMLISTVGISHTGAVSRYIFGVPELRGGVSLVAALIGVFAVPQVLSMVCERRQKEYIAEYRSQPGVALKTIWEVILEPVHFLRSALIGTFVGILPGAGSPVAALLSYNEAVRWSKDKSRYGKGDLRGVTASEIANNACAPASMIPLVTLGVPGSAPAAVVAGALTLRGLNPGPDLFQSNGTLVYSFGWSLMLAGVMTFILGTLLSPWLARMVSIPLRLLAPLIMFLSVIGAYAIRNDLFDVYLMLGLGLFTFLVGKLDFHPGPIGLGLILGPIVEPALVQSMYLSDATSYGRVFFGSTVDIVLIVLTVLSVGCVLWTQIKESKQARANMAVEGLSATVVDVTEEAVCEE